MSLIIKLSAELSNELLQPLQFKFVYFNKYEILSLVYLIQGEVINKNYKEIKILDIIKNNYSKYHIFNLKNSKCKILKSLKLKLDL